MKKKISGMSMTEVAVTISVGVAIGLFAVLIAMLSGCRDLPRYIEGSMKVNLPKNLYTQPIDPCDPIYQVMSRPPKSWVDQFGDSERSAFGYQHALARQQRAELRQMIVDVNDVLAESLKSQIELQAKLWKVIGRDPNDI